MDEEPLLEVVLFPVLEELDEVEEAGEDELWEAATEEFCAPEEAGEVAEAAAEVLAEDAGVGFIGDELLVGCPPVLRSCGELTLAVVVVESAYLQELELRLVTVVLLLMIGDTAPGEVTAWWCSGCR